MGNQKNSKPNDLNDLLNAIFRVEYDYMTLRTPTGWLLWCQPITDEADLNTVIEHANRNIKQWLDNENRI